MNIVGNTTVVILSLVFVATLITIIFTLLDQKKFNIKNVDTELGDFLNMLYTASTKSNNDTNKVVEKFIQELKHYEDQNTKTKEGLNNFVKHIMLEMEKMKEHIASIQELALQKEEKIRRYEDGYDQVKIKNFNKGLFRILELIKEERVKQDNVLLLEVQDDILLLLENNGIEKLTIKIGTDFKEYSKVAKVIATEDTEDITKDFLIKEVRKDGYYIQVDDNTVKVLIPAEVIIYKLNSGVENV